ARTDEQKRGGHQREKGREVHRHGRQRYRETPGLASPRGAIPGPRYDPRSAYCARMVFDLPASTWSMTSRLSDPAPVLVPKCQTPVASTMNSPARKVWRCPPSYSTVTSPSRT